MMKAEVKGVRRNRLTFEGFDWTGDCLYGLKRKVIVRYSLSDRRQIYVFDLKDQFLGVVEPVDYRTERSCRGEDHCRETATSSPNKEAFQHGESGLSGSDRSDFAKKS